METATLINLDIMKFWELTPSEFSLMVMAYSKKQKAEQEERITCSYLTAMWAAQWFSKKKPDSLKKILNKEEKQMTDEQMLKQVEMLNSMFGGEVR